MDFAESLERRAKAFDVGVSSELRARGLLTLRTGRSCWVFKLILTDRFRTRVYFRAAIHAVPQAVSFDFVRLGTEACGAKAPEANAPRKATLENF